jgi:DNA-binding response OmpR family regulator
MATSDARQLHVLLVEDNQIFRQGLEVFLEGQGVCVAAVGDVFSARQQLAGTVFDVVVLDLMLPDEDGRVLAREVAGRGGPPIVITSSLIGESDRILGLEMGADDYMSKPFSFRELLARIRAVHRRREAGMRAQPRRVCRFGTFVADLTAHTVVDGDRHLALTQAEHVLLTVFLEHPRRVLARSRLIDLTQVGDERALERTIDVLIGRLRRKLEPDALHPMIIETVRGAGYRLSQDVIWEDGY